MTHRIYLDHAATTPVDPQVLEAMLPYFTNSFGNPSSIHSYGRETRKAIEDSRAVIAKEIGASATNEIIFTGSGSESDNLAIRGIAYAYRQKGNHIITSSIEHHAVYDTCKALEKEGFKVTYLPVNEVGLISVDNVVNALTPETILVSIMHANNEVGTIQPIAEISKILQDRKIFFHTDAVQTVGTIPVNVQDLGVDLLSMAAHKFYGPKGVGALYVRKGIKLNQLIYGGAQERNRRAGTENIAGIVGMAKALELANANLEANSKRILELREYLIDNVLGKLDYVRLNGDRKQRLPGNANFSFEFIEGEALLLNLDLKGIAASSGSACTSGSLEPSHVLLSMGICHEIAHGSLRISIGKANTKQDIDYLLEVLPEIVNKLRAMSPLYNVSNERKECQTCTLKK
ncbi:MAG TPA: cysteine desulfurase NifS [Bacillota bacterium]|jgi:cysteine desulfurase|nr:cysteine desulfurase NifS [Bacillota bacterium]HOL10906.1 cysteine desulfurase NifS [Bacillota bacterium]HPO98069.1 cysteine desulfurase NifS [Bacillota bacterium]